MAENLHPYLLISKIHLEVQQRGPQGLKPLFLAALSGTAEQAAEKVA
jgi:hypothetical protein